MNVHIYKYTCLTNLHMGSGDVNYNIIDDEVERDPITNLPILHASGIKGALREHFTQKALPQEEIDRIFGTLSRTKESIGTGAYKFMDGRFLSRPMRIGGSASMSHISVVSLGALNDYLRTLTDFGCNHYSIDAIDELTDADFGENQFLTNCPYPGIQVEGEKTGMLPQNIIDQLSQLKDVLGRFVAVAKDLDKYPLPVVARNHLENGRSRNLWYEEIVPHQSVFYQLIVTTTETMDLPLEQEPIQFGGNATLGCGYIRIQRIGGTK